MEVRENEGAAPSHHSVRSPDAEFVDALISGASKFGLSLRPAEVEALVTMYRALVEWNKRVNLTSILEPRSVAIRHVVDSLTCLLAAEFSEVKSCVDVGSGAGLPGLPLALHCPEVEMTLVEAVAKKASFLEHVAGLLGLANVRVIQARAEELGRENSYRETFDMAVSRGVAALPVLLEYCLPLVKVGGRFIAMKGPDVDREIYQASAALGELGGRVSGIREVELPEGMGIHTLVVVEKVGVTPGKYPRRPGIPAKRPIS
ncbi:MAG TPA: 16S rRNA (guanine(527)-N(7))-methyltransferase RsmG [Firmicutes bacterium]|nr:16S rRNA (guanine(527)-N(7))-methyltransferase RsmG [Bacillota bacterium]